MSKRFGRNQKRKLKDIIAKLTLKIRELEKNNLELIGMLNRFNKASGAIMANYNGSKLQRDACRVLGLDIGDECEPSENRQTIRDV